MKDEDSESKSLKVKRQVWTRRTDRKRKRTQVNCTSGTKLWLFKEGNHLRNFFKFGENCSSVFKHSFLRPGVEFCKNSKTQNHQNEVLLPWNRQPGQWNLWKASYSQTKWVTVRGFSLILFKRLYLWPEMDFSRNSKT